MWVLADLPGVRCLDAIAIAEAAEGIPRHLLLAIGLVESGRPAPVLMGMAPWPWTVNVNGRGIYLPTKARAIVVARAARDTGARSLDVGCLQVSLSNHPHAFGSLVEAFDPLANARFAASFLRRLYEREHDWLAAAAAYHSQKPGASTRYRARVARTWNRLGP
jgi:Transglycosylase SLT domain